MTKQEILKCLKERSSNNRLRFPESLAIDSNNGILTIQMTKKGLEGNMQTDSSAFEGWAIAIKAIAPELAINVIIKWEKYDIKSSNLHYNRFLYRVIRFTQSYKWAAADPLDEECKKDLDKICNEINDWVVNYPETAAQEIAEKGEAQLERNMLSVLSGIKNHQLPVGLFLKVKSKATCQTPSQGSQIDLWTINDNTFTVYELKKDSNRKVGIISELMFYTNVIKDLVEKNIHFAKGAENENNRGFKEVFDNISKGIITKVCGVFLTNDLHPLLQAGDKKLFEILNDNMRDIKYQQCGFKISSIYTIMS